MSSPLRKHLFAALAATAVVATGCASDPPADPETTASEETDPQQAEAAPGSRIAVSLEGQLGVLDAVTLEIIDLFPSERFTRVNPVGDGRHVLVTTSEGFQVLDTVAPELTDTVFAAEAAGHVVQHAGKTVLFSDGWGETTIFDTNALLDSGGELPEVRRHQADSPHHGVSIVLEDETLITTVGDESARAGAVALVPHEDHYHRLASSDECPGIHGEGTTADEVAVFGCEDGALLFAGDRFVKLDAPDDFGRMGNAYVSDDSPVVVGDYKNDPDAEGFLLNHVALIDTENETYEVAELGDVEFTWRGAGRGPDGLFYALSTDGAIHALDPATGELTGDSFPVVDPWEGPEEWQTPHPGMITHGDIAYVVDVSNQRLVSVDLTTGEILAEGEELPSFPNEIALNVGAH